MSAKVKNWEKLSEVLLQKTRVFDLFSQKMRAPSQDYEDDFYYIVVRDWVNIVPITENNEVVLVEQYRFGIHQPTLEIPGGIIDPGDTPIQAALRELEEETGYVADKAEPLGFVHPNPAIQTNRLHSFFARNVRLEKEQDLDPAEDIAVHLVPFADIPRLIAEHRITHTLVISAFYRFFALHTSEFRSPFNEF